MAKDKELLQKIENAYTLATSIESAQKRRRIKLWWKNLWAKCKKYFQTRTK